MEDGVQRLVKKKITKREFPPDLKAVKLLLDGGDEAFSDEELEAEKKRLIEMLKENKFD